MIRQVREHLFKVCSAGLSLPTLQYLPGSMELATCYVVGRPDVAENATTRALAEVTVPLYVIGRTLRDNRAQAELDDAADALVDLLWNPPPADGFVLRMQQVLASVVPIGATDYPAYTALIVAETTHCP